MVEAHNVDWAKIKKSLCYRDDYESKNQRERLWKEMDVNGNGFLSLAEIDKGLRDNLRLDEIFKSKPAIRKAYEASRKLNQSSKSKHADDYVTRSEFKSLLFYLRQYFEYYQAFARIDIGDDNRIDLKEFIAATPKLEKWVGKIKDPKKEFEWIDSNGGGQITFDEFLVWATSKNLDLDDDDD